MLNLWTYVDPHDYNMALKILNLMRSLHNEDITEEMIMRAAEQEEWQERLLAKPRRPTRLDKKKRPKKKIAGQELGHDESQMLKNPNSSGPHPKRIPRETVRKMRAMVRELRNEVRDKYKEELNVKNLLTCDEDGRWNPAGFRRAANILKQLSLVRIDREKSLSMERLLPS